MTVCSGCNKITGVCTHCQKCFHQHCKCDPCQHGERRNRECVFCHREAGGPGSLRVLICGDRHWADYQTIYKVVTDLRKKSDIACVIEGEAQGADILGKEVADVFGIPVERYPANWKEFGYAAGPIRNREMLEKGRPDLVIAFHDHISNSKGTADMLRIAKRANVKTMLVSHKKAETIV